MQAWLAVAALSAAACQKAERSDATGPCVVFADRLVYASKQTYSTPRPELAATPNRLLAFDGAVAVVAFDHELIDFFADEHQLLALDTDGVIWRTADLARWSTLAVAMNLHPRSLAVLDGAVYVGTLDSKLFRLAGWTSPAT